MNNAQSPDIGALIADGNTLFTAIEQAKDAILDQMQSLAETDPSSAKFQQTEDKFYLATWLWIASSMPFTTWKKPKNADFFGKNLTK